MNSSSGEKADTEVNLKELFLGLWAYKFIILCTTVLGMVIFTVQGLNSTKVYTSSAFFKINNLSNKSQSSEFGVLSGFVGLNIENTDILPEEGVIGRVAVLEINKSLDLESDNYFNKYTDNNIKDPVWKSSLKQMLGYENTIKNPDELKWQSIVKQYSQNIKIEKNDSNVTIISATHENPNRSAEIANAVMNKIINDDKMSSKNFTNEQIAFLSASMAEAQNDLELVQSKLQAFTVENGGSTMQSFLIGSSRLDILRNRLNNTKELLNALTDLKTILQNGNMTSNDYTKLALKHPIVDQVNFRRILGQSEITSSWEWPQFNVVIEVLSTLNDRKINLENQIIVSLEEAENSSAEVEVYAKLKREEKLAEATYTVLMEQVKSQSIKSGFVPNNTQIYEFAAPPTSPDNANIKNSLLLGSVFGFFIGCLISFGISILRNVYYSKEKLSADSNASFEATFKFFTFLKNNKFGNIKDVRAKKFVPIVRNLVLEIYKSDSSFVAFSSLRSGLKSKNIAKIIADLIHDEKFKIAIIDFSTKNETQNYADDKKIFGSYKEIDNSKNIYMLEPNSDQIAINTLQKRTFSEDLNQLKKSFDLVLVCADQKDCSSVLRSMQSLDFFHILIAKTNHTKQKMLTELVSIKSVQGLLHV